MIGYGTGNSLAYPPSGICGKLVSPPVVESPHGIHETDIAVLDQIEKCASTSLELLCHEYHKTKVSFYNLRPRRLSFPHRLSELCKISQELFRRHPKQILQLRCRPTAVPAQRTVSHIHALVGIVAHGLHSLLPEG